MLMAEMAKSASDGTSDIVPLTPVSSDMVAPSAASNTKQKHAEALKSVRDQSSLGVLCWKHPKWSQGFLWVRSAIPHSLSATLTEIALPLPSMPSSKLLNGTATSTLASHLHLFKIVMPISAARFEQLLESHPN